MGELEQLRTLTWTGEVERAEALAREVLKKLSANPGANAEAYVEANIHLINALRWRRNPKKYPEALALARRIRCGDIEFSMILAGMLFEMGHDAAAVDNKFHAIYAPSPMRRWGGESLAGQRLLVLGYPSRDVAGELVPFGQLGRVDARHIVWKTADTRWCPIFERTDGRVRVVEKSQKILAVDCYVSCAELPRLTLDRGRLARPPRYIEPDRKAVNRYAAMLPRDKPVVGVAWRGGRPDFRNPPLSDFAALAGLPATFICLQYGNVAADLAQLRALGMDVLQVPEWDPVASLDDAFALTETCDLVVTNDQSAAHIAGALGKPTYLLSAFYSHSTTFGPPGRSVFYPSLRVLTQPRLGQWAPVFQELRPLLESAIEGHRHLGFGNAMCHAAASNPHRQESREPVGIGAQRR